MVFLKKWSLFSFLLGLSFCRSIPFVPNQYEGDVIRFGKGGGITGSVTEFILTDKNELYRGEGMMDRQFSRVKSLPKATFQRFTQNFQVLNLGAMEVDRPGDLYFFVESHLDGTTHRITWGDNRFDPPRNLVLFYNLLVEITKD
ncbi:MAG: hypothetical protein KDC57_08355 [Saprospiraceae bacterium]|nr:hypothetical protein [Saprospiraceae bacterium]